MLSFSVDDSEAENVGALAARLGVDRSQFLRDAVHQYLVRLRSEQDAATWERVPPTEAEQALARMADWGPAEDWSDWADAAR